MLMHSWGWKEKIRQDSFQWMRHTNKESAGVTLSSIFQTGFTMFHGPTFWKPYWRVSSHAVGTDRSPLLQASPSHWSPQLDPLPLPSTSEQPIWSDLVWISDNYGCVGTYLAAQNVIIDHHTIIMFPWFSRDFPHWNCLFLPAIMVSSVPRAFCSWIPDIAGCSTPSTSRNNTRTCRVADVSCRFVPFFNQSIDEMSLFEMMKSVCLFLSSCLWMTQTYWEWSQISMTNGINSMAFSPCGIFCGPQLWLVNVIPLQRCVASTSADYFTIKSLYPINLNDTYQPIIHWTFW